MPPFFHNGGMAKKKKLRTEFRKNRSSRARQSDVTREFAPATNAGRMRRAERISGKGELSRKRVVVGESASESGGFGVVPEVDLSVCRRGRVVAVYGLSSDIETDDAQFAITPLAGSSKHWPPINGTSWRPATGCIFGRRAAKGNHRTSRTSRGIISRTSRGRQQIIATNVDQIVIVASAAEPYLKPNLIDRFLITAEQNGIAPLICINKVDLVSPAGLQPLVGVYSRMGYRIVLVSAVRPTASN